MRSRYRPRAKITRARALREASAVSGKSWACAYCGRDPCPVTRRGYVGSHLNLGGIMCVAVGMRASQNLWLREQNEAIAAGRADPADRGE